MPDPESLFTERIDRNPSNEFLRSAGLSDTFESRDVRFRRKYCDINLGPSTIQVFETSTYTVTYRSPLSVILKETTHKRGVHEPDLN